MVIVFSPLIIAGIIIAGIYILLLQEFIYYSKCQRIKKNIKILVTMQIFSKSL